MLINISNLSTDFNYSKSVEIELMSMLHKIGYLPTLYGMEWPNGYHPQYDVKVNGITYEIKISSNSELSIEYSRYDDTPSGINLSTSTHYIFVNPGYSNIDGISFITGKVRVMKTDYLRSVKIYEDKIYKPTINSPGSKCRIIDPKNINDGWVCDIPCLINNGIVGYDFSKIYRKNKSVCFYK